MNEFNEPNLVNMGSGNFVPEIKVGAAHLFDSSPQLQLTARGKPSVPVSQGKFT
jgi:hypothetical protein